MFEGLSEYFSTAEFMPHGHCYLWKPPLVWTMVTTDALIGLAYLSISISLYVLVRRIRLPFSAMFIAFGLFIFACGATHFMEIYNLWVPNYWLAAMIKVVTAAASVATALLMFPIQPKIAALSGSARLSEARRIELEAAKRDLESRVEERTHALKVAVESRDEFLSIASHELKTPLTPLKMQIQMIQRSLKKAKEGSMDAATLAESFDISLLQIDRLTALIENLLDVSRIQAGTIVSDLSDVKIGEVIREVTDRFREPLRAAGYTLTLQLDESVVGHWDRMRIEQVVTNLLSNAIKYGNRKPIFISLVRVGDTVELKVRDEGLGIPPDMTAKVFERFERGVSHVSVSGLGLGLYIVKQIVDAHGGHVTVTSDVGRGSEFTVTLPLKPKA